MIKSNEETKQDLEIFAEEMELSTPHLMTAVLWKCEEENITPSEAWDELKELLRVPAYRVSFRKNSTFTTKGTK